MKYFNQEIDFDKLLNTEFGQQLYDLAPHLFEEEGKPKKQLDGELSEEQQK